MTVKPFRIEIADTQIDWIRNRLATARWPDVPESEPWQYGADDAAMRELVDYWLNHYDWRAREDHLNRWPHFLAEIDDYVIHFICEKGSGSNPVPIIISHGWPGSFAEFSKVIDRLAHPERFGGNAEDGLTVVVPSLPGFGFSSKPRKPVGVRRIARLFDRLMTEELGYPGYIAQGGDYGSLITNWLGAEGDGCKAIHLNYLMNIFTPPQGPEEEAARERWNQWYQLEGAYSHVQSTKPMNLAYAMADSPIGVAAWIFEKMRGGADLDSGDPWSVYSREDVIDNIMVYLVSDTFGTASWMYASYPDGPPFPSERIAKPTAVAHFPGESNFWPRSYAERRYDLVRWTDMPAGGHFAALEQPELFAADVLGFAGMVRG